MMDDHRNPSRVSMRDQMSDRIAAGEFTIEGLNEMTERIHADPEDVGRLAAKTIAASLAFEPESIMARAGIGRERQSFYMFDVDHTLELSDGPVLMKDVWELRALDHGIGICGNWGHITFNQLMPNYQFQELFSFIGPMHMSKRQFLEQVKAWTHYADYIMVGNDNRITPGVSEDAIAAEEAGWDFILEKDFAKGAR